MPRCGACNTEVASFVLRSSTKTPKVWIAAGAGSENIQVTRLLPNSPPSPLKIPCPSLPNRLPPPATIRAAPIRSVAAFAPAWAPSNYRCKSRCVSSPLPVLPFSPQHLLFSCQASCLTPEAAPLPDPAVPCSTAAATPLPIRWRPGPARPGSCFPSRPTAPGSTLLAAPLPIWWVSARIPIRHPLVPPDGCEAESGT
jgi:hypothetical protein